MARIWGATCSRSRVMLNTCAAAYHDTAARATHYPHRMPAHGDLIGCVSGFRAAGTPAAEAAWQGPAAQAASEALQCPSAAMTLQCQACSANTWHAPDPIAP